MVKLGVTGFMPMNGITQLSIQSDLLHDNKYYIVHSDMSLQGEALHRLLWDNSHSRTTIVLHWETTDMDGSGGCPRKAIPGFERVVTKRKTKKITTTLMKRYR